MGENIDITDEELATIRTFENFDLVMLLSEINDFGWPMARKLIPMIVAAAKAQGQSETQ